MNGLIVDKKHGDSSNNRCKFSREHKAHTHKFLYTKNTKVSTKNTKPRYGRSFMHNKLGTSLCQSLTLVSLVLSFASFVLKNVAY